MNYSRILVPIDFSEDSVQALHTAVHEFARPQTQLLLLHVQEGLPDDHNPLSKGRMQAVSRADMQEEPHPGGAPHDSATARLQALIEPFKARFGQADVLVLTGQPTDVIIETAASRGTDLLIMGSHGRGGLGRMLFGSTTYDVARKVTCSVLISRARRA